MSVRRRPTRKLGFVLLENYDNKLMAEGIAFAVAMAQKSMQTHAEKIRNNYLLMEQRGELPQKKWMKYEKSETEANAARDEGNICYRNGEYSRALENYNKSLCFAPTGSKTVALAYANRALTYLKTGFYKFCLENIDLAFEHGYPENLTHKLVDRKNDCVTATAANKDSLEMHGPPPSPELSHPANPENPFIANVVQLSDDGHLRSNKDLMPGEFIITEKPFIKMVLLPGAYTRCYNCASDNFLNLKPCPKATMIMFCSDKCAEEAWNGFYKYECPIIDGLHDIFDKAPIIAIRMALKALSIFESPKDLMTSLCSEKIHPLKIDFRNASERDKFRAMYSLHIHNYEERPIEEIFHYAAILAMAWDMLKKYTDLKEFLRVPEFENFFLDMLMKLLHIANSHVQEPAIFKGDYQIDIFGKPIADVGVFAIMTSYLEHSCAPNVGITAHGAVTVIRPIKAGERLYCGATINHWNATRSMRQEIIAAKLYFNCKCEACTKNYGTYGNLRSKGLIPPKIRNMSTKKMTIEEARKIIPLISKSLKTADLQYPCHDIAFMAQSLADCIGQIFLRDTLDSVFVQRK